MVFKKGPKTKTAVSIEGEPKKKGITSLKAIQNLLKAMIGPGCLSLPLGFSQTGLWAGVVLLLVFGGITYLSYRKIVRCAHILRKRHPHLPPLQYGTLAEEAFKTTFKPLRPYSTVAKFTVNFCVFLMTLGLCSVYLVFIKTHIKEFIDFEWPSLAVTDGPILLAEILFLMILCGMKSIHFISYISMAGNVLMVIALLIVFQGLVREEHHWDSLPAFTGFSQLALASGSILYAFEGQTIILPMENKMESPDEMLGFSGVLSVGVTIVTIVYTICGVLGYVTYGDAVRGSITLNQPDTPIFIASRILLVFVVFSGYVIQQYACVDMMWPTIQKNLSERFSMSQLWKKCAYATFTTLFILLSLVVALAVPDLENIIPLVGVTAGMMLALILPSIIEIVVRLPKWIAERKYFSMSIHMTLNILFLFFGFILLVQGLHLNIGNIIEKSSQSGK